MGCGASAQKVRQAVKGPTPEELEQQAIEAERIAAEERAERLRQEIAKKRARNLEYQRSEAEWWRSQQEPLLILKESLISRSETEKDLVNVARPGWDEVAQRVVAEAQKLEVLTGQREPLIGLFHIGLFCDPYIGSNNVLWKFGGSLSARKLCKQLGQLLGAVAELPAADLGLQGKDLDAVKGAAEQLVQAEGRSTALFDQIEKSGVAGFKACSKLRQELEELDTGNCLCVVGGLSKANGNPQDKEFCIFYTFERESHDMFSLTVSSSADSATGSKHPQQTDSGKPRFLGNWRIRNVPQSLLCEEVFLYLLMSLNSSRGAHDFNVSAPLYEWLLPYLVKEEDGNLHKCTCPKSSTPDCFVSHMRSGLSCFKSIVLGLRHLLLRYGLNSGKRKSVMYGLRHLQVMVLLQHLRGMREASVRVSDSTRIAVEIACRQLAQKAVREDTAGRLDVRGLLQVYALIIAVSHALRSVASVKGPQVPPGILAWDAALCSESAGPGERTYLQFSGFALALRPVVSPRDLGNMPSDSKVRHVDFLLLQAMAPVHDIKALVDSIFLLNDLVEQLSSSDENEWRWGHIAGMIEWAVCHLIPVPGQHAGDGELWLKLQLDKTKQMELLKALHSLIFAYAAATTDFGLFRYSNAAYGAQLITMRALVACFEQVNRYCWTGESKVQKAFSRMVPVEGAPCGSAYLNFANLTADVPLTNPRMLELRDHLMSSSRLARPESPALFRFPYMKDKAWEFSDGDGEVAATLDAVESLLVAAGISIFEVPRFLQDVINRLNDQWKREAERATLAQPPGMPPIVPKVLRPEDLPRSVKLWAWGMHPEALAKHVPEWRLLMDVVFTLHWLSLPPSIRIPLSRVSNTKPSFQWNPSVTIKNGSTFIINVRGQFLSRLLTADLNLEEKTVQGCSLLSWASLSRHEPAAAGGDPEAAVVGLKSMSLPPFGRKSADGNSSAVTEEEAEALLCALSAPYVRIPLLVGFLSADRCHLLRFERIRVLFEAALSEPGQWVSGSSPLPVRTAPVEDRSVIGRPLGLLAMEASQGTETLLADLVRLVEKASLIAGAEGVDEDYDGSSAEIFMCVLRVAVRCEAALRKWGPSAQVALEAPVLEAFRTSTARRQLRAWFDTACRKMDDEASVRFQVHLALTVGAGLVSLSEEDLAIGISALMYLNSWGSTAMTEPGSDGVDLPKERFGISCTEIMEMQQALRLAVLQVFPGGLGSEGLKRMLSRVIMSVSHSTDATIGEPWTDRDERGAPLQPGHFSGGDAGHRVTVDLQTFRVVFHMCKLRPLPPEISQAIDYRDLFGERFPSCQLSKYAYGMVAQMHLDGEDFEIRHWSKNNKREAPGSTGHTYNSFYFDGLSWSQVRDFRSVLDRFTELGADADGVSTLLQMEYFGDQACTIFGTRVSASYYMPSDELNGHNDVPCLICATEGAHTLWLEVCIDRHRDSIISGGEAMEQGQAQQDWNSRSRMKHGVRVFRLVDHGSRCLRVLNWAADYNRAYRSDWLPNVRPRSSPRPADLEHAVGWLVGGKPSGQHPPAKDCSWLPDVSYDQNLEIVHLSKSMTDEQGGGEVCPREWVPNRLMLGLLPGALLESRRFHFWRTGTTLRGVPCPDCPSRGNGWFDYELVIELNSTGASGSPEAPSPGAFMGRFMSALKGAPVAPAPGRSEKFASLVEVVRIPPFASESMPAWRRLPLCLVNTAIVPGTSPWRPIVDLFAGIEPLSHVLIWAYAEGGKLAVVELPRLQLRFLPRGTPPRLYSVEFDGFYALPLYELEMVDARTTALSNLLAGLPHWLLLRKDTGEVTALVPNGTPLRPKVTTDPFTTNLVMDHRPLPDLEMRYFRWDLHIGGSLLLPSTSQGTLYLCLMKLLARDYISASRLVESCAFDEDLSPGEARIFSRFFIFGSCDDDADGDDPNSAGGFLDDLHPDACAIRAKLAQGAADFQNSADHASSAHLQSLRTYLDPANKSTSLRLDLDNPLRNFAHMSREVKFATQLTVPLQVPAPAGGRCRGSDAGSLFLTAAAKDLKFCADGQHLGQAVHMLHSNLQPIDDEKVSEFLFRYRYQGASNLKDRECGFLRLYAFAKGLSTATVCGKEVSLTITELLARMWCAQNPTTTGPEIRASITLLLMCNAKGNIVESNDPEFNNEDPDQGTSLLEEFPDLDGIITNNWVQLSQSTIRQPRGMSDADFRIQQIEHNKVQQWSKKVHLAGENVAKKAPLLKTDVRQFGGDMGSTSSGVKPITLKPQAQMLTGLEIPFASALANSEDESLMVRPLAIVCNAFIDCCEPATLQQDEADAMGNKTAAPMGDGLLPGDDEATALIGDGGPSADEATAPLLEDQAAAPEGDEAVGLQDDPGGVTARSKFSLNGLKGLAGSETEVAKGMIEDYAHGLRARTKWLANQKKMLPKVLNSKGDSYVPLAEAAKSTRVLISDAIEQWGADIKQVAQQHELLVNFTNDGTGGSTGVSHDGLIFWLSRCGGWEQTAWLEYCLGTLAFASDWAPPFGCRFHLLKDMNGTLTECHVAAILDAAQRLMYYASRASLLQTVVASATELAAACEDIASKHDGDVFLADLPDAMQQTLLQYGELLAVALAAERTNTYLKRSENDEADWTFDYRLLLFEYVSGFMLREKQHSAVLDIYDALAVKAEQRVVQMIMGSGKTACVAPLLTLLLSSPTCLVVNVVPNSLVAQTRSIFRRLFGITLSRRVFTMSFSRDDAKDQAGTTLMPPRSGLEVMNRLFKKLQTAKALSSVVITTPASMKSLILKYVEFELQGQDGRVHAQIRVLASILKLLRNDAAALVDEVDWVLDPLKSELNFPLGANVPYPQQAHRVNVALVLMDAVMLDRGSDGNSVAAAIFPKFRELESSEEMVALKTAIMQMLNRGYDEFALQRMPHLVLHSQDFYKELMLPLVADWFVCWFMLHETEFAGNTDSAKQEGRNLDASRRQQLVEFLVQPHAWDTDITKHIQSEEGVAEASRCILNLARTWLHAYLPFLISRADRVHFGLLDDEALIAAAAADAPTSRRLLAVPFVAKDVPAPAAEFAHPDILIGYTVLAYCIEGMRLNDIRVMLSELVRKATQEPGPVAMRPTARLFNDWIALAQSRRRARPGGGDELSKMQVADLPTIGHLGGHEVVEQVWEILRHEPEVNYWYMREKAFPKALRMQKTKLSSSGQELGSEMIFAKRAGFSGTPSALLPRELGACNFDLENLGEILMTLTDANVVCESVRVLSPDWTPEGLLTDLATSVSPPFHALIDTGAIITGLSNQQVAESLLKNLPSSEFDGVVFLDERDQQMVCLRNAASAMRLPESGVPKERRFCFYDQVHTTGIDVKHRVDAVAMVTINATTSYRDLAQGCWRMRGIGKGQTIHIVLTPEIHCLIGRRLGLDKDDVIGATEVVRFLMSNHFLSEAKRHVVLQYQNMGTVWRKRAFAMLINQSEQVMDDRNRRQPLLDQFVDPVDYELAKEVEAPILLADDLQQVFEYHHGWMTSACQGAIGECYLMLEHVRATKLQADGTSGCEEEKEKEQEKEMDLERDVEIQVVSESGSLIPWEIEGMVVGDLPEQLYDMNSFAMHGLSTKPLHFPAGTLLSHNHTFNNFPGGGYGQRRMKSVRCVLLCWDPCGDGRTVGISLQEAEALRRYAHVMEGGGEGNEFTNATGYFEVRLRSGALLAALPGGPPGGFHGPELELQNLALRFFNTDVDFNHAEITTLSKSFQQAGSTSKEREELVHLLFGARRRDGTAWQRTILAKAVWDDADKLSAGERLMRELCSAAAGQKLGWNGLWTALDRRRAMCVGLEDISAYAESARLEWSAREAAQLLAYIDVDGVGVADLTEFQSALEKQNILPRDEIKVVTDVGMRGSIRTVGRVQEFIQALDARFDAARAAIDNAREFAKPVLGFEARTDVVWPEQREALEALLKAKAQVPTGEDFEVLLLDPEVRLGAFGGTYAKSPWAAQPWQIQRGNKFKDCEPDLQAAIQRALAAGAPNFVYKSQGQEFVFNMKRNTYENRSTGKRKKIRKKPLESEEQDVDLDDGAEDNVNNKASKLKVPWLDEAVESNLCILELLGDIRDEETQLDASRLVHRILVTPTAELAGGRALRKAAKLRLSAAEDAVGQVQQIQRASEELAMTWNRLVEGDVAAAAAALRWGTLRPGRILLGLRALCTLHSHDKMLAGEMEPGLEPADALAAIGQLLSRTSRSALISAVALRVLIGFVLAWSKRPALAALCQQAESFAHRGREQFPADDAVRDLTDQLASSVREWRSKRS